MTITGMRFYRFADSTWVRSLFIVLAFVLVNKVMRLNDPEAALFTIGCGILMLLVLGYGVLFDVGRGQTALIGVYLFYLMSVGLLTWGLAYNVPDGSWTHVADWTVDVTDFVYFTIVGFLVLMLFTAIALAFQIRRILLTLILSSLFYLLGVGFLGFWCFTSGG